MADKKDEKKPFVPITAAEALAEQKAAMEANGFVEPQREESYIPEPERSDYEKNQEWYDTYFPTISREEEDRRERNVRTAQRWANFSNALAAVGNAVGGWYGAKPIELQPAQIPDLTAWKERLNAQRQRRAAMEDKQRDAYNAAMKTYSMAKHQQESAYQKSYQQWLNALYKGAATRYNADQKIAGTEQKYENAAKLNEQRHEQQVDLAHVRGEEARTTKQTVPGKNTAPAQKVDSTTTSTVKENADGSKTTTKTTTYGNTQRRSAGNSGGNTGNSGGQRRGKSRSKIGW